MVEVIHFPNAPITEALLDIRVKLPGQTDLAKLAAIHDTIKQRYPTKQERVSWRGHLEIEATPVAQVSQFGCGRTRRIFIYFG